MRGESYCPPELGCKKKMLARESDAKNERCDEDQKKSRLSLSLLKWIRGRKMVSLRATIAIYLFRDIAAS